MMTVNEILANEDLRQHEFPVCRDTVYLAHAGVCPLPRRVQEAVQRYSSLCLAGDQEEVVPPTFITETRSLAARLVGAQPEEIAFVGPTSLALSTVAAGIKFRRTENALIYFDDYPTNVYPWLALNDRGIKVKLLNLRQLGRIRPIDILGQVDDNTRLVAIASCHFVSGWRAEIDVIGKKLHDRNILLCVDGIQTLGAFPTDVTHVDFLAADAHKWLLGPCAAGLLYVRKSLQDSLRPLALGWHNVVCPNYVAQEEIRLRSDARRYEAGSANLLGLCGLRASLELILELGVDAISQELLRKRKFLIPALKAKGWEVVNGDAPEANCGGILSLTHPDADLPAVHERLLAARIVTSLRADREGKRYLRVSPHFYNTDAELARFVEAL